MSDIKHHKLPTEFSIMGYLLNDIYGFFKRVLERNNFLNLSVTSSQSNHQQEALSLPGINIQQQSLYK